MNDFTKEELEDILFCVRDHVGYQGDSIHTHLEDKIQSMIDNYCDNDSCKIDYDYQPLRCIKCMEIVKDE